MTAAQTKAAGRKIKLRYKKGKKQTSLQDSINRERDKAAKQAKAKGK